MPHRPPRTAFTLIELLVVVAIITALLAILLPSMSGALNVAVSASCQSNQRQIAVATLSYAADNRTVLPPQSATAIKWLTVDTRDAFDKYINGVADVFYCPTLDPPDKMAEPNIGLRGQPAQYYWDTPSNYNNLHVIGYFYLGNPTLGADPNTLWKDTEGRLGPQDDYVTRVGGGHATAAVLIADILPRPIDDNPASWFFRHPSDSAEPSAWINVAFADAHVESRTNAQAIPRHGYNNAQTKPIGW